MEVGEGGEGGTEPLVDPVLAEKWKPKVAMGFQQEWKVGQDGGWKFGVGGVDEGFHDVGDV